jgi:hypothetical protein
VCACCWGLAYFACMHELSVRLCGCAANTCLLVCLLLLRACICKPLSVVHAAMHGEGRGRERWEVGPAVVVACER